MRNTLQTLLQRRPLLVIVVAQLFGTSLWFSVNGVWSSLAIERGLTEAYLGYLTLAIQLGFILGTLAIAVTGLADRFRASAIFAVASVLGALFNIAFITAVTLPPIDILLRFLTGLCLAGVYPLGMKLVISWVPKHAGAALSWLVGMLTLGTALPHLLRGATLGMPWQWPLFTASALALLGALLVGLLGDGAQLPKGRQNIRVSDGLKGLQTPNFRAVAGGYFGHCWELYAFWMLVPLLVSREALRLDLTATFTPWIAFGVIALGAVGCVLGGRLSQHFGNYKVAYGALLASGLICLAYPFLMHLSPLFLLTLLALWGVVVIADSPQFSALAAATAPREQVGASLALMNAIGFALTLPAIWITSSWWLDYGPWVVLCLLPGPVLGLLTFRHLRR